MVTRTTGNPNDFLLPDLGEGLEEAELIEWVVKVGQKVSEHDILAKMETAKALVEVPSPRDGTIAALHGNPGQAIKVGSPLVSYQPGAGGASASTPAHASKPAAPAPKPEPENEEREDAGTVVGIRGEIPGVSTDGKARATPAVRRIARDLGVNIDTVKGTGIGGRVTQRDVEAAAKSPASSTRGAGAPTPTHKPPTPPTPHAGIRNPESGIRSDAPGSTTRLPFRGVRKTIAERLRHSINNAVHFTVMDEADVTALDEFRKRFAVASGEKLSLLPFVALAVIRVLQQRADEFARLNAILDDKTQEIVLHKAVHLGIATETPNGLMVPVVKNSNHLGVLELAREISRLAKSARDRSIPLDQLTGSTFTISNVGPMGGRFATPIINYPETGILAVGRAREAVVVKNGMFGVGKLLPLSLAADHRVVDGATAATALSQIIALLQDPEQLLPTER